MEQPDLRWPPIEALSNVHIASGDKLDIEEKYLAHNATVRQEQLRKGSSSFSKTHMTQYKLRLTCPRSSDALGGIYWDVPDTLREHIYAVYIVWNNDIIDYLKPTYMMYNNNSELRCIYTSTEFTLQRPFITTPFYTTTSNRTRPQTIRPGLTTENNRGETLRSKLTGTSTSQVTRTQTTHSHTATLEETLTLVVQFQEATFSPDMWTAETLTLSTNVTGWVITGMQLLKWIADAYHKQQKQLEVFYANLYPQSLAHDHDEGYYHQRSPGVTHTDSPSSSSTTFYACPWQKHKLVWPLYSLGNDAFLCCESTEKNSIGVRWTKCFYRTRPSFRITSRLCQFQQHQQHHNGSVL